MWVWRKSLRPPGLSAGAGLSRAPCPPLPSRSEDTLHRVAKKCTGEGDPVRQVPMSAPNAGCREGAKSTPQVTQGERESEFFEPRGSCGLSDHGEPRKDIGTQLSYSRTILAAIMGPPDLFPGPWGW